MIKPFIGSLREFYEGSFALFRPKATLTAVGLGTVSWLGVSVDQQTSGSANQKRNEEQ